MALQGQSHIKRARRSVARAKQRGVYSGKRSNSPPEHERCTLVRGGYELPHQAQLLQRDLTLEDVKRYSGETAPGYRLSADQLKEGRHHYEFVVRGPHYVAWKAFHSLAEMKTFAKAYGLKIIGNTSPGQSFGLVIPKKLRLAKLRCK